MLIMADTNVVLDLLEKRQPYFADSYAAFCRAFDHNAEVVISASAVTDIYYLLRKYLKSSGAAKEQIQELSNIVTFADVLSTDIHTALMSGIKDFEDALVAAIAARRSASFILTRNKKDFSGSKVMAVTPKEFVSQAW